MLTGRRVERDVVERLVATVQGGQGRALVVRGEAGAGKTALLDHLADRARVKGNRGTVESPAKIFKRTTVEGMEADFHAYCRFFSRAVRDEGRWRLMSFEVLLERDELRPGHAGEVLPVDVARLAGLRPSYRFLTWIPSTRGVTVSQDLLGDDRPAELDAFHQGETAWPAGTGRTPDPGEW